MHPGLPTNPLEIKRLGRGNEGKQDEEGNEGKMIRKEIENNLNSAKACL